MENIDHTTKSFLLAAVGISVAVWDVSFNLGVYRTIFFDKIFLIWIACTALLLASLILPVSKRPISKKGMLALAFPTFWLIVQVIDTKLPEYTSIDILILVISVAVNIMCLPYIAYVLISILQPEAMELHSRKLIFGLIGIALIVGTVGFLVGVHHNIFLTCEDFKLSGNDIPPNCRPLP